MKKVPENFAKGDLRFQIDIAMTQLQSFQQQRPRVAACTSMDPFENCIIYYTSFIFVAHLVFAYGSRLINNCQFQIPNEIKVTENRHLESAALSRTNLGTSKKNRKTAQLRQFDRSMHNVGTFPLHRVRNTAQTSVASIAEQLQDNMTT